MNTSPLPNIVDPEEVEKVEKELLEEILTSVTFNKMSPENAQALAKEFLDALPFHHRKDLLEKLQELAHKYPQAQSAYLDIAKPIEEQEKHEKLKKMAEEIKLGNIEKAIEIAKGGTV